MKVKATVKIEILEGKEKGMTDTYTTIAETKSQYTEFGIIELLRLEWRHIHDVHLFDKKERSEDD